MARSTSPLAIYSFNHDSFGKTTNRAGAAGDNVRYNADLTKTQMDAFLSANAQHLAEHSVHRSDDEIEAHLAELREGRSPIENAAHNTVDEITRSAGGNAAYNARAEVTYAVRSHVIPADPQAAAAWFDAQERGDRKNARMSDRFIGAPPRELTPEQCIEAVEKFCRDVTQDRVPWHFALHLELEKKDQPDWNPHTHIIFRDRDIETGRRFLYTTAGPKERRQLAEKGIEAWSTQRLREKWSANMNHALFRAGHDVQIDHRSLEEQGIDRAPQIHIGPNSRAATEKGYKFQSKDMLRGDRTIPYTLIDQGSRDEHNQRIVEDNKQREGNDRQKRQHPELVKLQEAQKVERLAMYRDQKRDRDVLGQAHGAESEQHKAWGKQHYANARNAAYKQVGTEFADRWKDIRGIADPDKRDQATAALKVAQKAANAATREHHAVAARVEKNAKWEAMKAGQLKERQELRATHGDETAALARQHAAEKLALNEKIREQHAQYQANRMAVRFGGKQGMAAQQKAASATIRFRHRNALDRAHAMQIDQHNAYARQLRAQARKDASAQVKERMAPQWQCVKDIEDRQQRTAAAKALKLQQTKLYTGTSMEFVAKAYVTIANAWQELQAKQAMERQHRRGPAAPGGDATPTMRNSANTAAAEQGRRTDLRSRLNAQRQTNQLRGAVPDRFRAQAGRAMQSLSNAVDANQKSQLRQAAESTRALTNEERANAPKEVRERLDHQDRKAKSDRFGWIKQRQQRGKDRGGGGRGR
jgi:hypothetical protein